MKKLFYIIEALLILVIFIALNGDLIVTIAERGGLTAYFNTNCMADVAIISTLFLNFAFLLPALFCFTAMAAGKSFDFCLNVIFAPFNFIEKITNK